MGCFGLAITATCLSFTVASAEQAAAKPQGLILYFPFDEGTGNKVKDLSDNSFEGKVSGAKWTAGRFGQALEFNGKDNFVAVDPIKVNPDKLTIELWFKPAADIKPGGARQDLLYRRDGSGRPHVTINRAKDGKLGFYFTAKDGSETAVRTKRTSWSAGTWYHVAATSETGVLKIYIDGKLQNARIIRKVPIDVQFDTGGISIGARETSQTFFQGTVDEVRLWNRVLTDDEVQKAYEGTLWKNSEL